MTLDWPVLVTSAARWLGAGALDGTLFAAAVWLVSATLLRRATGRVLALLWLVALVQFVLVHPFQLRPFEMQAIPLQAGGYRALEASAFNARHAWLAALYAGCVLGLLLRLLARQRRLRRRVAAFAPAEPSLVECVRALARRLSLAHVPDVRVTDAPIGPFTLGPARPTLVLPRWLAEPGARLDAVLLHELAHLARKDHWVMWFERGVATLFFFWPPVRWVSRKLDEARELACDERAIERGGFSAADYGRHLVDVVARAREQLAQGDGLAIGQSSFRLERRIDRLLEEAWARSPKWWVSCWQGVVLALLAIGSLFGVRPAQDLAPPLAAVLSAPSASNASNLSCNLDDSLGMSLPEPCAAQSCGTPCAP
ncbi:MAG: M56 family metallopeptidase [Deltaproteobacteria bacterium]